MWTLERIKAMDKLTGKVALRILRDLKRYEAEYREDREEWYRSGDGRRAKWFQRPGDDRPYNYGGKGYSFPAACVHGSNAWTDYDNICGPCEDGYSVYQLALWEAQEKVAEYNKRLEWVASAPHALPHDVRMDLFEWVREPVRSKL